MARKPANVTPAGGPSRCAIYTRKSTEDGLEQEFNSLDAQREACAAYILSQRHEGWVLVPGHYDDGGFSGGSMERPGLKRLLAEVEAGRVDVILVYKVDRLTRSLADFAKIVEILDAKGASFVSITQAFNTTTSMGRLTLNVLLSFAQFEREVTGERIRDKIAASKRKGLWMGGPVPLGYVVQERKLVVEEAEGALVRHIMRRYLELPSVNALIAELDRDGHRTKIQIRTSGPHKGGCPFRRGTLYHLLSNRIYLGDIVHKGVAHPGEHAAIVPRDLWEAVQARLAARGPGVAILKRAASNRPMLAGILYDGLGRVMQSTHASKGSKRYRYYATRDATADAPAWRVGAHDVERLVAAQLSALLLDRNRIARLVAGVDPRRVDSAMTAAAQMETRPDLAEMGVERIVLEEDRMVIRISERVLLKSCGLTIADTHENTITLCTPINRVRRGHELRLIIPGEPSKATTPPERSERLVALMAEAMAAREMVLASSDQPLSMIASAQGCCRKRLVKLVRLSWLAPDLVEAILDGRQTARLTPAMLIEIALPLDWDQQRPMLAAA